MRYVLQVLDFIVVCCDKSVGDGANVHIEMECALCVSGVLVGEFANGRFVEIELAGAD